MEEQHQEDPAHQLVSQTARMTLMAASVAAEQVARHWASQKQRQAQIAREDARRWQARYDSQRRLAGVEVFAADARWIRVADVDQVARVWETARAWSQLEPEEFGPHADRIRILARDRYGIDLAVPDDNGGSEQRMYTETQHAGDSIHRAQAKTDTAAAETITATARTDATTDAAAAGGYLQLRQDSNGAYQSREPLHNTDTATSYDTDPRRAALLRRAANAGVDPRVAEGRARAADAQAWPLRHATDATKPTRPGGAQTAMPPRRNQDIAPGR